jgi:regulator of sigma E protease
MGYVETETSVKRVLAVLKQLFTGKIPVRSLGGPIMIVKVAGSAASEGTARLLVFLTFLSANLAVLNFLPIPALDGGHMLFLAAEGIRGKPLNERLQVTLTLIGVGCLLSLMVLVFTLDIQRIF